MQTASNFSSRTFFFKSIVGCALAAVAFGGGVSYFGGWNYSEIAQFGAAVIGGIAGALGAWKTSRLLAPGV